MFFFFFFFFLILSKSSCVCVTGPEYIFKGIRSALMQKMMSRERLGGGGGGGGGMERLFGSLRLAAVQFHGKYC